MRSRWRLSLAILVALAALAIVALGTLGAAACGALDRVERAEDRSTAAEDLPAAPEPAPPRGPRVLTTGPNDYGVDSAGGWSDLCLTYDDWLAGPMVSCLRVRPVGDSGEYSATDQAIYECWREARGGDPLPECWPLERSRRELY
ncbi:MAG: hypothetical protein OXI03_05880 [Chloroflexota bacterium]|nr:hypothetical protein [Chloroflexota bacterium]